jgi:hypothetical protein
MCPRHHSPREQPGGVDRREAAPCTAARVRLRSAPRDGTSPRKCACTPRPSRPFPAERSARNNVGRRRSLNRGTRRHESLLERPAPPAIRPWPATPEVPRFPAPPVRRPAGFRQTGDGGSRPSRRRTSRKPRQASMRPIDPQRASHEPDRRQSPHTRGIRRGIDVVTSHSQDPRVRHPWAARTRCRAGRHQPLRFSTLSIYLVMNVAPCAHPDSRRQAPGQPAEVPPQGMGGRGRAMFATQLKHALPPSGEGPPPSPDTPLIHPLPRLPAAA